MSDFEYRRLQQEALQGKARLLRDRVRLGRLTPDMLDLAAYLGDPAARTARGNAAPREPADLMKWVLDLDRWGEDALVRATFAAVRFALPIFEDRFPDDARPRGAVDAAEAWVDCPCSRHGEAADAAARAAEAAAQETRRGAAASGEPEDEAAFEAAEAIAVVTDIGAGDPARYSHYAARAADAAVSWIDRNEAVVEGDVRAGIRDALVPWALGRGGRT